MIKSQIEFKREDLEDKNIKISFEQMPIHKERFGMDVLVTIQDQHENIINLLLSSTEYTVLSRFFSQIR